MALYYLSGDQVGKNNSERKEKRQTRRRKVAKVVLVEARAAFLLLTKKNVLKLANRLTKLYQKNPQKVKAFWEKFGGNFDKLRAAIEAGAGSKLPAMSVALEVTLATALPLFIEITKLFKQEGISTPDEEAADKDAMNTAEMELETNPDFKKTTADMPVDKKTALVKSAKKKDSADDDTLGSMIDTASPVNMAFKTLFFAGVISGFYPAAWPLKIVSVVAGAMLFALFAGDIITEKNYPKWLKKMFGNRR